MSFESLREIPINFDDWSRSLDPETADDRATLAGAAAQLLRSPVLLRVLASLERDAIEHTIMVPTEDPCEVAQRVCDLKAAFRVRAMLKRLAGDADYDQMRADAMTGRSE